MGGILSELGQMLAGGLRGASKSGNAARILAREADTGLARRFVAPPAMAAPVAPSGIDALHASPHDFQKFEWSPRTRGTGEGAQAYGEGLYFAESPDTMEEYYKQFASKNDPRPKLWSFIADAKRYARKNKGNGPVDANIIREELNLQDHPDLKALASNDRALEAMARMSNYDLNTPGAVPEYMLEDARYLESIMPEGKAHRYAVKLKADPERMIDWDKPLSEQRGLLEPLLARYGGADAVKAKSDAFEQLSERTLQDSSLQPQWDAMHKDPAVRLGDLLKQMERPVNPYGYDAAAKATGERLYHSLKTSIGGDEASRIFREQGIPGIKYLDAGSRGTSTTYSVGAPGKTYIPYTDKAVAEKQVEMLRSRGIADAEIREQAGTGTRNYVVWDDSIIEVVKKFGIAGALGAGLITQEMADQMRAQGMPDSVSRKTSPGGPSAMPTRERFGG